MSNKKRLPIFGTFFACPQPDCRGTCRNSPLIQGGHFVCEECFSRFKQTGPEEVEEVQTVTIHPKTLGAIEMLAREGACAMQQAHVDFSDAAMKLAKAYADVYRTRWSNNRGFYEKRAERCRAALTPPQPVAGKPKVPPFRFTESDEPFVGDPVKANNPKKYGRKK